MIFAVALVPMMAIIAVAIDFGSAVVVKTQLDLAADAAVLTAVTTAANAITTDPNYLTDGQTAGQVRFAAQAGHVASAGTPVYTIAVTRSGAKIIGQATWSVAYHTFLGSLLGVSTFTISGTASATIQVGAPYLDVEILLDNSGSMEIAATDSDIQTMQQLTPCSASGAYYWVSGAWNQVSPASGQPYNAYQCSSSGQSYDGSLTCPIPASSPYTFSTFNPTSSSQGPSCQGYLKQVNSKYPLAGAPCGFACHFDTSKPAGTGSDYYAVARSTIGQSNQITLRFDLIKAAVNQLITTMEADNVPAINNLNVGIFTFDTALTQVYPASGVAANNWAAAIAAVGGPPTVANGQDTGIQPYPGGRHPQHRFPGRHERPRAAIDRSRRRHDRVRAAQGSDTGDRWR